MPAQRRNQMKAYVLLVALPGSRAHTRSHAVEPRPEVGPHGLSSRRKEAVAIASSEGGAEARTALGLGRPVQGPANLTAALAVVESALPATVLSMANRAFAVGSFGHALVPQGKLKPGTSLRATPVTPTVANLILGRPSLRRQRASSPSTEHSPGRATNEWALGEATALDKPMESRHRDSGESPDLDGWKLPCANQFIEETSAALQQLRRLTHVDHE
jgi:hypothetical protein